jgi:hypothetical protein
MSRRNDNTGFSKSFQTTPMKSLRSIINKFSPNEIGTFRLFLSSHSKNGRNKKLELFDHLVDQSLDIPSLHRTKASRQSVYQLKKRLKEDLYAFLLTQDQIRDSNDRSFLEMECHKKLYCFKILFDKGILDHANQVLNEVLNIASKHSFHTLYLEAVNLKNIYFPLAQTDVLRQVPVSHEIQKLKKSLDRNFYVNKYLSESGSYLHDSDMCFRLRLMNQLTGFDMAESEPVIGRLMEVNHLLYAREFDAAHDTLMELLEREPDISGHGALSTLVYIELTKVCICRNAIAEAKTWLPQSGPALQRADAFAHVLLELELIVALRTADQDRLTEILERSKHTKGITDNPVLSARWSFFSLIISFYRGDFKRVIKTTNDHSILLVKSKGWLTNLKMLELLSIYRLKDSDWLYYKIESFRKMLGTTDGKQQRVSQIVSLLKAHVTGKGLSSSEVQDKILKIERESPWHPLSNELINYCTYAAAMFHAEGSAAVFRAPSYA